MGNPLRMELELSAQHEQQQQQAEQKQHGSKFDQLESSESLGRENMDAPLLSTDARAEDDHQREAGGGVVADMTMKKVEMLRGMGFEEHEDKKLLLQSKSSNSDKESSAVDVRTATTTISTPNAAWPATEEDITPEQIQEMEKTTYTAFVREDNYGTFGREVPIPEKVLLCLAVVTIVPIRLILLLLILVLYYSICKVCTIARLPGDEEGQENYGYLTGIRRRVIVFTGRWLARSLLFVLGFYRIKVTHRTPDVMKRLDLGRGGRDNDVRNLSHLQLGLNNYLVARQTVQEVTLDNEGLLETSKGYPGAIVSNHVSYLDILYHMSASFPSFVAKRSVTKLPLIGLMSKCMGCVYVQRESKSPNFKGVSGIIKERLQAAHRDPTGSPIFLLFPEGTTSNGDYLLPFKTGAFLAGTPTLPVILRYNYSRFSPAWETITGLRHVLLLLCQFVNYLEVTRLPVYYPNAKECSDPKTYANNVRTLISNEGDLKTTDVGLHEKRVYHAALAGKVLPDKPRTKQD